MKHRIEGLLSHDAVLRSQGFSWQGAISSVYNGLPFRMLVI